MKTIQIFLTVALASLCGVASAQWQWIDKDGHKVFSDRAPPTEISDKNILKRPNSHMPAQPAASDAGASDTATNAPAAPALLASSKPVGGLDKELEAKKKQAQDAEAAKRKAAEVEVIKAKIENCARAKQAKTTLESGVRLGRVNASGEREIMDDAARSMELKRIQGIMAKDCQ